jgi:RNA polymerase sigma-70 factor (ECF subfamily)
MSDGEAYTDFILRIRAGDEQAAAELVRRYESLIRREVRLQLEDRRLNRLFDSMDVCQSVLASFFVRTAAGQFDLDRPDQLVRLLVTMARNKLASEARRQRRHRRDDRRVGSDSEALAAVADPSPGPSATVAGEELLKQFRGCLDPEELRIADFRAEGLPWAEIAARLGGTAQSRRMQYTRAVDRAAKAMGLDEDADE